MNKLTIILFFSVSLLLCSNLFCQNKANEFKNRNNIIINTVAKEIENNLKVFQDSLYNFGNRTNSRYLFNQVFIMVKCDKSGKAKEIIIDKNCPIEIKQLLKHWVKKSFDKIATNKYEINLKNKVFLWAYDFEFKTFSDTKGNRSYLGDIQRDNLKQMDFESEVIWLGSHLIFMQI